MHFSLERLKMMLLAVLTMLLAATRSKLVVVWRLLKPFVKAIKEIIESRENATREDVFQDGECSGAF